MASRPPHGPRVQALRQEVEALARTRDEELAVILEAEVSVDGGLRRQAVVGASPWLLAVAWYEMLDALETRSWERSALRELELADDLFGPVLDFQAGDATVHLERFESTEQAREFMETLGVPGLDRITWSGAGAASSRDRTSEPAEDPAASGPPGGESSSPEDRVAEAPESPSQAEPAPPSEGEPATDATPRRPGSPGRTPRPAATPDPEPQPSPSFLKSSSPEFGEPGPSTDVGGAGAGGRSGARRRRRKASADPAESTTSIRFTPSDSPPPAPQAWRPAWGTIIVLVLACTVAVLLISIPDRLLQREGFEATERPARLEGRGSRDRIPEGLVGLEFGMTQAEIRDVFPPPVTDPLQAADGGEPQGESTEKPEWTVDTTFGSEPASCTLLFSQADTLRGMQCQVRGQNGYHRHVTVEEAVYVALVKAFGPPTSGSAAPNRSVLLAQAEEPAHRDASWIWSGEAALLRLDSTYHDREQGYPESKITVENTEILVQ